MKRIVSIAIICGLVNSGFAQNFGIGTSSPTQKLEVDGNIKIGDNISVEGTSSCRVYRNLATYSLNSSAAAGAFVITTSHPWNANCMFKINVEGYFYDATGPYELSVGGYMYVNNDFYNLGYINNGGKKLNVRLARSPSGTIALILGNESATYPYPKLTVTDYLQGYNNINESYADGWGISQVTSLSGYSNIYTVPEVTSSGSSAGLTIQTKYNVWTNTTTSTSTQTYIDATGSDLSITAKSSGSIFKITVYAQGYQASGNGCNIGIKYVNTNTLIAGVDGGSGESWAGFGNGLTTSSWTITRVAFHNPGTVAGNTYTYRAMLGRWTTGTQYLNYPGYSNSSVITIEEIGQ